VKQIEIHEEKFDNKPSKKITITFQNDDKETYYYCYRCKIQDKKIGRYDKNDEIVYTISDITKKQIEKLKNK
jgi:hypothetical protein